MVYCECEMCHFTLCDKIENANVKIPSHKPHKQKNKILKILAAFAMYDVLKWKVEKKKTKKKKCRENGSRRKVCRIKSSDFVFSAVRFAAVCMDNI